MDEFDFSEYLIHFVFGDFGVETKIVKMDILGIFSLSKCPLYIYPANGNYSTYEGGRGQRVDTRHWSSAYYMDRTWMQQGQILQLTTQNGYEV